MMTGMIPLILTSLLRVLRIRRYQLENDPRFLARVDRARESLRAGHGVKLENLRKR